MTLYIIGLLSVGVFSVTGIMAAEKKNVDIFGVLMLSFVTALGGGTIRDVLLGRYPIFWITDVNYLWAVIISTVFFFFSNRIFKFPDKLLLIMDALGVSLFNILAINMTMSMNYHWIIALIMGIMTGIAGGIIRDMMTNATPLALRRELYATPLLIGGLLFIFLRQYNIPYDIAFWSGFISSLLIRLASIQYDLYYPAFLMYKSRK